MKLAVCFALFLGLATVTQGHTEDYYIYQTAKGELVISNKEPPPGSQIIKRVPSATDREAPQGQEPVKQQPNPQPEGSPKPSKAKQGACNLSHNTSFELVADCIPGPTCVVFALISIGKKNRFGWSLRLS